MDAEIQRAIDQAIKQVRDEVSAARATMMYEERALWREALIATAAVGNANTDTAVASLGRLEARLDAHEKTVEQLDRDVSAKAKNPAFTAISALEEAHEAAKAEARQSVQIEGGGAA